MTIVDGFEVLSKITVNKSDIIFVDIMMSRFEVVQPAY